MTIAEAIANRIPRIRQPLWANPACYLRLPLFKDGQHGPWAELYDERSQKAVGLRPGSQRLPVTMISNEDGFEPYSGAASEYEQDRESFARGYEEG